MKTVDRQFQEFQSETWTRSWAALGLHKLREMKDQPNPLRGILNRQIYNLEELVHHEDRDKNNLLLIIDFFKFWNIRRKP